MKTFMSTTRRVQRLAKLYPPSWRERYEDEFVDFMEQSINDKPHSFKRTTNVLFKSSAVRLGDVGIGGLPANTATTTRAKLGTTSLLATVFSVFCLFYWSYAMIAWNAGPSPSSTAVSFWTGAITVFTILLAATLTLIGVSVVFHSFNRLLRNHDRRLLWPLIFVIGSTITFSNDVHQFTRMLIARGGIDWAHPGWAIKQLAGATNVSSTISIWGPSEELSHIFTKLGVLYMSAPIAILFFAFGMAMLIRRTDFSPRAVRSGMAAARVLALEMVLFLVSYAGWFSAGGSKVLHWVLQPFTQMEYSLLIVITLIALLAAKASFGPRPQRNHIEILDSENQSA
jgi:hypothetical protein